MKEKIEVFRGHTEECLHHLSISIATSRDQGTKAKTAMAEFCGVCVSTVARWCTKPYKLPKGESLVKLFCYLDMQGYRIIELERMSNARRLMIELVGFGVYSSQDAAVQVGYKSNQNLYQVLWGTWAPGPDKEQKMWDLWKAKKNDLEGAKESARKKYYVDLPRDLDQKGDAQGGSVSPLLLVYRGAVLRFMEGLLVLLEEEGVPEDLLQNVAPHQSSASTILRLSAHLSELSSKLIMSDQEKGGQNA